ncbi:MAG: hypothetical protein RIS86_1165 [Planctomycetota bacterium]|jgi:hypothetical protein
MPSATPSSAPSSAPSTTASAKAWTSVAASWRQASGQSRPVRPVAAALVGDGAAVVRAEGTGGAGAISITAFARVERGTVAEAMAAASIPPTEIVLALPREDALLATETLPTDDEAELRDMARMSIARDAAADGVEAVGDFQVVERAAGRTRVVLAAVPRARVVARVESAATAVGRLSVRALGTAALLRTSAELATGLVIAIDLASSSCEIVVARDGAFALARAVELDAGDVESRAATVALDFRRLLAALRAEDAGAAPARVVVLGAADAAEALVRRLASMAGCPCVRLESHPRVALRADATAARIREDFLAEGWPLAGLLLEEGAPAGQAIDLLHPVPPIDVAARTRQRVLAVAGLALIAAMAGWTFGNMSWRALEERRDGLEEKARGALPELKRFKRDELKAKHLDALRELSPAWLAHLDALRRFAPDQTLVVFDGMTAQLSGTELEYGDGRFSAKPELKFVLDGEAKDRATADGLRDALVKEKGYTLGSTGADARGGRRLPYPFAYTLRTTNLVPKAPEDGAAAPAATRTGGAG